MVDKNPVLVALLLLLSLGISTAQAQQQQGQEPYFGLFRWGVMVNALHNPYATNNMHSGVDLEIHVPKVPLFFGLGASYYYSRDTDRRWLREGEVRDWANVGGGSLFVGVKPWETGHHCIGLSGGYALAFDVHLSNQADKVYSDHGFLVRGTYDYRFNSCVSIGILVQYTRYCVHASTPDILSVGVSAGFLL